MDEEHRPGTLRVGIPKRASQLGLLSKPLRISDYLPWDHVHTICDTDELAFSVTSVPPWFIPSADH